MSGTRKRSSAGMTRTKVIVGAAIFGFVLMMLLLMALSLLAEKEILPPPMYKVCALVCAAIAVFAAAATAVKETGTSRLITALCTAVSIFALLLIAGAIEGKCLPLNKETPILLCVTLCAGVIPAMLPGKRNRKHKISKRK